MSGGSLLPQRVSPPFAPVNGRWMHQQSGFLRHLVELQPFRKLSLLILSFSRAHMSTTVQFRTRKHGDHAHSKSVCHR